jgi:FMN phosphatase YigB (HAD superfamily)
MKLNANIILTDVDGVLLSWDTAFDNYVQNKGFIPCFNNNLKYDLTKRYNIGTEVMMDLLREFNNSDNIAFLEPLRDSIQYVKKLHIGHGFNFHAITSFGKSKSSQEARKLNLCTLFGEKVFEKFVFLDIGEPKDTVLLEYKDTNYWWIEDRIDNAISGHKVGLKSILMEHGHNLDFEHPKIPLVKNWQEIYQLITKEAD